MDAVAAEIESLMTITAMNTQLGGKLKSLALTSTVMAVDIDENERTSALLSLDWQIRVFTREGQPETLI